MPLSTQDLSDTLSSVVEHTGKHVVRVEGGRRRTSSGIVWGPNLVVTAAHALERDELVVGQEGVEWRARVRGRDPSTDLALLECEGTLAPATLHDGAGLKVGQLALALGRPGQTVRATSGILSAVGKQPWRSARGGEIDFFLEADAPHQPGFSGGPLVDLEGRVLGLTTTGLVRGASVAIPGATLRRVVAQLERHGKIRRSYLGLQLQPLQLPDAVREATGEEVGLLVAGVDAGGPAERAGLSYGDTLLHLGDDSVRTLQDLYDYLRADHADQEVPVKYFRQGQVVNSKVTLGGR